MRSAILLLFFALAPMAPAAWSASNLEPWSIWVGSDEDNRIKVDHSDWGKFLATYVIVDASGINKVAYDSVSTMDRRDLQDYIAQLANIDPRRLRKNEQLAYWINLYNAVTIEVVLNNPGKSSIRRMGQSFFSTGPWGDELVTVAGEALTLDDIEHRILRPIWRDHRIHFAVNCASLGCPNLLVEPFTAENAERLMDEGERDFINHERGVSFDDRGRVQASKIFEWYQSDFADDETELLRYLSMHHEKLADRLRSYSGRVQYQYQWTLNSPDS